MSDDYKVTVDGTPRWTCSTPESAVSRAKGYKDNHKSVTVTQDGKILHRWIDGEKVK